jgi:hypothetical protein
MLMVCPKCAVISILHANSFKPELEIPDPTPQPQEMAPAAGNVALLVSAATAAVLLLAGGFIINVPAW